MVPVGVTNYTYAWVGSNSATPQRNDTYRNAVGGTYLITVTGLVATPNLATVTGVRGTVQIRGFLQNGVYYDNVQTSTSGISLTFNGVNYTSVTTTTNNVVSLSAGTVTTTTTQVYTGQGTLYVAADGKVTGAETGYFVNGTWYLNNHVGSAANLTLPNGHAYTWYDYFTNYVKDASGQVVPVVTETYTGNNSRQFTIAADGTLSGSESGCVVNGMWYVNYAHDTETVDYTAPDGTHYISRTLLTSYVPDGNGGASSSVSEAYSASASYTGLYTEFYNSNYTGPYVGTFIVDPNGRITGDVTGYKINGNFYINGYAASPVSGLSSLSLLGNTYAFTQGAASYAFDTQNNPTSTHWTDNYSSPTGDQVQITYSWAAGDEHPTQLISGSDSYAGSFSADYTGGINNLVWQARTAPSFTQATLYLNGTLLNWQSGAIDTAGVVTDTYGPDSNGRTLVFKGSVRDFMQNTGNADVSLNGASVGSYAHGASLSIAGWDVEISAPNRDTPFFSVATLWVDGSPYAFSNGYGDTSGNRKDVYLTSGGTVSISGNTASFPNASVQVNHNGEIHTGTGSFHKGGGFTVQGVDVSAIAPDTGPPAFWVGDVFYRRTAGTNQYTSFPTAGNSLSLDGTDPSAMRVSGTQASSPIFGTFDPTVGVFVVYLQNTQSRLPACPARADGSQVPSGNESSFAPAVHVGTEVWNFLGTTTDDGDNGSTAAYYGNTRNAVYTADPAAAPLTSDDHRRLLKIRNSEQYQFVVTLTDYRTNTSAIGIYLSTNGIFQTGATNSLPMPIYSVDPNANDTPWQPNPAPNAGSGPATILVGNQVWRYNYQYDGNAYYMGYYDGQQLTLSAPNAGGVRTITVTDPVNGNATGMLNDVNGSTTLSNGQTINSGTLTGAQVQPQNLATVGGDLGVPGNIISIGSLNGDSTTAGATLQFSDTGTQAMFGTALGRSAAQWVWWRVDPANAAGFVPTMVVDSTFGLVLYDPANPSTATVKLNPSANAVSEIPKLKLTNQTLEEPGSVVTQALGDERYLRFSGPTVSIGANGVNIGASVNSGIGNTVAIGGNAYAGQDALSLGGYAGLGNSGQSSISIGNMSGAAGENAIAVGLGARSAGVSSIGLGIGTSTLQHGGIAIGEATVSNQPGQVVLGSFNQPTVETDAPSPNDSIFIIGNGTSVNSRSNAFTISRIGDVQVLGGLTVTGPATLISGSVQHFLTVGTFLDVRGDLAVFGNSTFNGTLKIQGQPVLTQDAADARYIQTSQVGGGGNSAILTQDAADTRYLQKGQPIRVAPAGDIPMSDDFKALPPGVTAPTAP